MVLATNSEALAEYALNAGRENPGRQWILTPWDTWERNPAYAGPPQRHPEDDHDEEPPMAQCGDCGCTLDNFGWCTASGCCGLGAATAEGAAMAYQDRMARRDAHLKSLGFGPNDDVGAPAVVVALDDWDVPF